MARLDSTVVGVALPTIAGDLGGGLESQQWIVNAYLLALGSLILIGGSLGDLYGERRIFLIGAAGFGIAAAGRALAPTVETLIAARGLKGAFGALLTPASRAAIIGAFGPEEHRHRVHRARAAARRAQAAAARSSLAFGRHARKVVLRAPSLAASARYRIVRVAASSDRV